jgi:hypothetical protein
MCLERNAVSIALDGGYYQKENDAGGMQQIAEKAVDVKHTVVLLIFPPQVTQ